MSLLDSITQGFKQDKTAQTGAFQNFASRYAPQSAAGKQANTPFIGPVGMSKIPSGTTAGVKTPQNTIQNTVQGPTLPTKTQHRSPQIGFFDDYDKAVAADNAYNPSSVNLKVDDTIKSEALNTVPSLTTLSETRKGKERSVLISRFQEEEEKLLTGIAKQRDFLNRLVTEQDREFLSAEKNPTGQLIGGLNSDLSRLSKEQAIELNARTGQLNSMLDTLELYQGYRPQMVGNPVIDDTTGEAFAYIQDPYTGEIFTESMGYVATPQVEDPNDNLISLSEGEAVWDPISQSVVYKNPRTGQPSGGSSPGFEGTLPYGFDFQDPAQVAALPVSDLTKAIITGTGTMKDLTPTTKAEVLAEMYSIGFNPQSYVAGRLIQLVELWKKVDPFYKGLIQGLNPLSTKLSPSAASFESSKTVLTRIVARLNDVGMLSDQDVLDYKTAMPSRSDRNLDVVKAKTEGISQAVTGQAGLTTGNLGNSTTGPRPSVDQLFTDEMFQ